MKVIKIIVCLTIVVAAIAYAGGNIIDIGGAEWGSKEELKVEVVTDTDSGQKFYLLTGGNPKTKLAAKKIPVGNINIVIDAAKMVQTVKATGSISNIIAGTVDTTSFVMDASSNKSGSVVANLTLGTLDMVKMKGMGVGTVLAKGMKMVMADSVENVATDAGFKGKGIKIMSKVGAVGAGSNTWVGIATGGAVSLADVTADKCKVKMIKAKAAVDVTLNASGLGSADKPKSKVMAKVAGTTYIPVADAAAAAALGWRVDKFKSITVEYTAGGSTNEPATNVVLNVSL